MQPQSGNTGGAGSELRSDAQQVSASAANRVHSEVDARKGAAAEQVKSVSSAIQRAADGIDDGAPSWLKSAFQQGAEQIQKFAETLEQKDSRELLNQVEDFARNRPMPFLAACAAAGFAASRVLKAGGQAGGSQSTGQAAGSASTFDPSSPEPAFSGTSRGEFA